MKRKAYTLAEMLITIGIIGVISAMVIPTVVSGHMKQIYAQRLATAVADFENAMSTMIIAEGVDNLFETEAWQVIRVPGRNTYTFHSANANTTEAIKTELQAKMGKYLSLIGHRNSNARIYRALSGDAWFSNAQNMVHYKTKKGVEYLFFANAYGPNVASAKTETEALAAGCNYQSQAARIYIDVNGEEGPNRLGRDFFGFDLSAEGKLYPNGSPDYNFYKNENAVDVERECVTNRNGLYCAEYLAKNGYKMDY